jgi:hypothetical protein
MKVSRTKRNEVKQREPLSDEEKAREIQIQRKFDEEMKQKQLARNQVSTTVTS